MQLPESAFYEYSGPRVPQQPGIQLHPSSFLEYTGPRNQETPFSPYSENYLRSTGAYGRPQQPQVSVPPPSYGGGFQLPPSAFYEYTGPRVTTPPSGYQLPPSAFYEYTGPRT